MPDLIRHLIRRHPHQSRYLRMAAVFFALHPHWRPLVRTEIKIAATGKAAAFCFERKTRHEPAHRAGILAIVALPPAAFGGCPLGGLRVAPSSLVPQNKKQLPRRLLLFALSGKRDSNSRPRPWQGRALPTELFPPGGRILAASRKRKRTFFSLDLLKISALGMQRYELFLHSQIFFNFFQRLSGEM